ncbi:hypothetical protein SUGI_1494130 [Cryptomeria japonica]|uniref:Uncharacterized protein n=1 Tax=Cryptomeria japonica TaxID=3369 RepID=A0AAD3NVT7_CRYJA|nr:hypothetical protein SUGI_1224270 [Cryptomeria japonica]GLJ59142.1 hypothetical protein SUGI_1494130 [Cryptomeria japonica]
MKIYYDHKEELGIQGSRSRGWDASGSRSGATAYATGHKRNPYHEHEHNQLGLLGRENHHLSIALDMEGKLAMLAGTYATTGASTASSTIGGTRG